MYTVRRPKRTLSALALALAAAGVAVGSGADFTSQAANPSNTFAAGTLTQSNSLANAAIFAPSNLRPGAPDQTGTVDIANTGSLPGGFSLSRDQVAVTDVGVPEAAGALDGKIDLTIVDCGKFVGTTAPSCTSGTQIYQGSLAAMASTGLGTFAAGEQHRYQFGAHLDASADNSYQGDSATARFVWNSVQVP